MKTIPFGMTLITHSVSSRKVRTDSLMSSTSWSAKRTGTYGNMPEHCGIQKYGISCTHPPVRCVIPILLTTNVMGFLEPLPRSYIAFYKERCKYI
jgi:hypothetical protein